MALIRPIASRSTLNPNVLAQNETTNTNTCISSYTCTGNETGRIICTGLGSNVYSGHTFTVTLNGTDITSTGTALFTGSHCGSSIAFNLNLSEGDVITATISLTGSSSYLDSYITEL